MKRCTKCGRVKSDDAFAPRSDGGGLQPWCRACKAARQRAYTKTERGLQVKRAAQQRFSETEAYREIQKRSARKRRARNPEQEFARKAVSDALRAGRIKRGPCANAGPECAGRIEGHHHKGYAREHWLDVAWLCRRHHQLAHGRAAA